MLIRQMHYDSIEKEESFSFWKNLVLVVIFFTITPVALGISLFSLFSFRNTETVHAEITVENPNLIELPRSGVRVYASLPSTFPSVSGYASSSDARVELVRQYLQRYNSPMEPYAETVVAAADKYELDYRFIVAIAQQESNLCKVIPPGSYNCWGWGIHSRGTLGFSSYSQGIETVPKGLREEYLNKGFRTIEDIAGKYAPPSKEAWTFGVTFFLKEME